MNNQYSVHHFADIVTLCQIINSAHSCWCLLWLSTQGRVVVIYTERADSIGMILRYRVHLHLPPSPPLPCPFCTERNIFVTSYSLPWMMSPFQNRVYSNKKEFDSQGSKRLIWEGKQQWKWQYCVFWKWPHLPLNVVTIRYKSVSADYTLLYKTSCLFVAMVQHVRPTQTWTRYRA